MENKEVKELKAGNLDINMSTLIKGVAIIFMVIHHLFGFPEWYIKGIDYSNITILGKTLRQCTLYSVKICVTIYAFLTGYAYFYTKTPTTKYGIKKIWGLLKRYWFILFFVFMPFVLIKNPNLINLKTIVLNLFALDKRIITFSWYVYFYIFLMLTMPFVVKMFNGKKIYEFIFPIACITSLTFFIDYFKQVIPTNLKWIINDLSNILYCYPTVLIGYLVAKYDVFSTFFDKYFKPKYLWQAFIIVALILGSRSKWEKIININLDVIYVPIIIYALIIIFGNLKTNWIKKIISLLGQNSLNIWFFAFNNIC